MRRLGTYVLSLGCVLGLSFVAHGSGNACSVNPDEAMKRMTQGNMRFASGKSCHPREDEHRRQDTAARGQHPFVTVLSCSDSRAPVELICDEGIGDLFVIRVAGNVAGTDEIGSAEYGAEHMGIRLLVVLGHTGCGAVTAAVTNAELHGCIAALVKRIEPAVARVRQKHPDLKGDALLTASIRTNVWLSVENLLKNSEILRELVKTDKLKVVGAIYDLKTGRIDWLGEHPRQKQLVNESRPAEKSHTGSHRKAGATTQPARSLKPAA